MNRPFRFARIPELCCLLMAVAASLAFGAEQASPLEELHSADQIRRLTADQASRHYPVRLRGVVTFFDDSQFYRFIQDDTAGIYFFIGEGIVNPGLESGQSVEIEGETNPGEYAPIIMPHRIRILGQGQFPAAKPVPFEQMASGQEDSQFIEIHGTVRYARYDSQTRYYLLDIATGGGRFTALATQIPVARGEDLVDSVIRARGVCVTRFNRQRQLFDLRLLVPRPADVVVETPAPSEPFAVAAAPIGSLLRFRPEGAYGHRVKVRGTVVYHQTNDNTLFIQDATEGLHIETRQDGKLLPGDIVEVLGFPARGDYTPMMQDAVFRKLGTGQLPIPEDVSADQALNGTRDGRLVRINAIVLDRARHSQEQFLVLESGGFIFHAYLDRRNRGVDFAYLENGSKITATGICVIETGTEWHPGSDWRAKSFRLLLRSPADIFVLQRPPWLTLQKLLWALGLLALVMLTAFAWVGVLRRRVHEQTGIIRQKLAAEAALKERYEDLVENANDVVFTHEIDGRITSINRAGEKLLQRQREEIVSRNLAELVVAEQRNGVEQWLAQVAKGGEPPSAEWDFLNTTGHRIRLEINSRVLESGGKRVEVESIARDVTERKRLEREILEISTREQRRIGHDLHDGVCQHLAGIAYRTDILADQLEEKGVVESKEVERISRFINEVITQTRGVARGLSPARLAEEGLEAALEELAANASNLFKIQCRFTCEEPLPPIDDGVLLHLYYIAQEAVSNAAKHGNPSNVNISLARDGDRFVLTVQDDGVGFQLPATGSAGMGIRIMRYRARFIGASLDLKTQPGRGTQVSCVFYSASRASAEGLADDRAIRQPAASVVR
jgi:PAS domain S-box-containing protein